jgi:hypothetical protein
MSIIKFEHHSVSVSSREDLVGKHREYCLCHKCDKLKPNTPDNCSIAQKLYELDIENQITTPVFYCAEFDEKPGEA